MSSGVDEPKSLMPVEQWFPGFAAPLVIAGPCSAESEEQVLRTAEALRALPQVHMFRAGIWKPRTRPGGFQGVGTVGLAWLARVKREFGLPVACEVADPAHVRAALDFGIDLLWIGARTATNPFAVAHLAAAMDGMDAAVLVKNPINPDLSLWLGAVERIQGAGVRKLGAIHRGFNTINETKWRNAPLWEIPIDLEKDHPELPIICDPSHIAGNRALLQEVCQKAYDLEMDGLMIEAHIDPSAALTDKAQQVTPAELGALLDGLVVRDPKATDAAFVSRMTALRMRVDDVDEEIINALAKRFQIVEEMGRVKRERGATILQAPRWKEVVESRVRMGEEKGLRAAFLNEILRLIHEEAIDIQERILNPES